MPTGNAAPSNPARLTARRKAWIEPVCGLEGRRICGPTRTTRPAFRDAAIELLLSNTASLTGEWCSPPRSSVDRHRRSIRPAPKWSHRIGREFAALCVLDVDHPTSSNWPARPARPRSANRSLAGRQARSTSDAWWAGALAKARSPPRPTIGDLRLDRCRIPCAPLRAEKCPQGAELPHCSLANWGTCIDTLRLKECPRAEVGVVTDLRSRYALGAGSPCWEACRSGASMLRMSTRHKMSLVSQSSFADRVAYPRTSSRCVWSIPRCGVPVAEPADPTTLDGLFQLQCRDLIDQIRSLGFDPYIWVDMINDLGATAAAKTILATKMPLVATRWSSKRPTRTDVGA